MYLLMILDLLVPVLDLASELSISVIQNELPVAKETDPSSDPLGSPLGRLHTIFHQYALVRPQLAFKSSLLM